MQQWKTGQNGFAVRIGLNRTDAIWVFVLVHAFTFVAITEL